MDLISLRRIMIIKLIGDGLNVPGAPEGADGWLRGDRRRAQAIMRRWRTRRYLIAVGLASDGAKSICSALNVGIQRALRVSANISGLMMADSRHHLAARRSARRRARHRHTPQRTTRLLLPYAISARLPYFAVVGHVMSAVNLLDTPFRDEMRDNDMYRVMATRSSIA